MFKPSTLVSMEILSTGYYYCYYCLVYYVEALHMRFGYQQKTNWCVPKILLANTFRNVQGNNLPQSKWNVIRSQSKKAKAALFEKNNPGKWCRRCVMSLKSLSKCFAEKCCILSICKCSWKSFFARATSERHGASFLSLCALLVYLIRYKRKKHMWYALHTHR